MELVDKLFATATSDWFSFWWPNTSISIRKLCALHGGLEAENRTLRKNVEHYNKLYTEKANSLTEYGNGIEEITNRLADVMDWSTATAKEVTEIVAELEKKINS